MLPDERDRAYLWDMREAAKEILAFVKGVKYSEFVENRMIRYAVERQLMVLGEAANHDSPGYREAHPEISWRQIIGQRNILAYEYGEVKKVERVWSAATISVPKLLEKLETLLPEE